MSVRLRGLGGRNKSLGGCLRRLWAADVGEGGKQGRGKRRRKRKKRKRRKGEGADLISILSQLPL